MQIIFQYVDWIQMLTLWTCSLSPLGLQSNELWHVHCHRVKSARAWDCELLIDELRVDNDAFDHLYSLYCHIFLLWCRSGLSGRLQAATEWLVGSDSPQNLADFAGAFAGSPQVLTEWESVSPLQSRHLDAAQDIFSFGLQPTINFEFWPLV